MKRAVKWASTGVNRRPGRKVQDGRRRPRKVQCRRQQIVNRVTCSKTQQWEIVRYFWHKSLFKVFMLKVPQKLKILKNKANFITSEFKNTSFLFCQRRPQKSAGWSTSMAAFFSVDSRQLFSSRPNKMIFSFD